MGTAWRYRLYVSEFGDAYRLAHSSAYEFPTWKKAEEQALQTYKVGFRKKYPHYKIDSQSRSIEEEPEPTPEPTPEPPQEPTPEPTQKPLPAVETIAYWMEKGYTFSEAIVISQWVRENQQTPTPEKIKEILPAKFPVPDSMLPLAQSFENSGAMIFRAIQDISKTPNPIECLAEEFRRVGLEDWAEKADEIYKELFSLVGELSGGE